MVKNLFDLDKMARSDRKKESNRLLIRGLGFIPLLISLLLFVGTLINLYLANMFFAVNYGLLTFAYVVAGISIIIGTEKL